MREKKQINIEVGERIRAARENRGLTQEQLAERIDVSTQYISDLERGVVGPSLSTFRSVCVELRVTSDSLLFGSPGIRDLSQISLLCSRLSDKQFHLLEDIIEKYSEATTIK